MMAKKLEGAEFRVFRCLIREYQFERFEDICVELTHRPALTPDEVAEALASLRDSGFAEEFQPGHWRYTQNGYGVHRTLLSELLPEDKAADAG
jgi:hypothetical protein